MQNYFAQKRWAPYTVGLLIGLLSCFTFLSANRPIGITTAFENTAALTESAVAPGHMQDSTYATDPDKEPKIDWEWMLVIGVFIGAYMSSKYSGDRSTTSTPPLWKWRFGPGKGKRYLTAFCGGALLMFGARLAQGCTSGHGISGALQLALSSWVFLPIIFISGAVTAFLIYGREGASHV